MNVGWDSLFQCKLTLPRQQRPCYVSHICHFWKWRHCRRSPWFRRKFSDNTWKKQNRHGLRFLLWRDITFSGAKKSRVIRDHSWFFQRYVLYRKSKPLTYSSQCKTLCFFRLGKWKIIFETEILKASHIPSFHCLLSSIHGR